MTDQSEFAARLIALHVPGSPLRLPDPWDAGTARLLAADGFWERADIGANAARAAFEPATSLRDA